MADGDNQPCFEVKIGGVIGEESTASVASRQTCSVGLSFLPYSCCITINLIGEGFNKNKRIHNKYRVLETVALEELSPKLEIHILNLEKAKLFNVFDDKENKALVNRLKFIETDDREVRRMLAENSQMMRKANAAIEVIEMSPKEKWLYDSRMKYEHDKASYRNEGYQEGIEQGFADGIHQKAVETANSLIEIGLSIENISKATGLNYAEIEKL
ncbi:Rpn family recombination-promoting nuclease/putative transposase [Treponema sp. OMZ 798]|uniref:Rpn family recombination-promoting nuclease/putative transposase n=1 Tax=unclassified Treponema TaxID=2638727 RepID=UPI003532324B